MRKVLENHNEVAHFWANKRQSQGKAGNMFFMNDTIYSYGYHFPIAKHYKNNLVLLTSKDYSVSTSKHKSITRQSIPDNLKVITVPEVDISQYSLKDHETNLKWFISTIKCDLGKANRARKYKGYHLNDANNQLRQLKKYLKIFRVKSKVSYKLRKDIDTVLNTDLSEIQQQVKEYEQKKQAEEKARIKAILPDWKNNEVYNLPYNDRQYLRLINNRTEIETSLHVKISVELFKRYADKFKAGINLTGEKIAGWKVTCQNSDLITIGCHKIPAAEIDYIYKLIK